MISAYVRKQRFTNGIIATLIVLTGLFLIGYGAKSIVSDVNYKVPKKNIEAVLAKSCENSIREVSLVPKKEEKGVISVKGYSLENPHTQMMKVSLAIQQCFGYKLSNFCMGDGCRKEAGSPLSFKLEYVGE